MRGGEGWSWEMWLPSLGMCIICVSLVFQEVGDVGGAMEDISTSP